jgi:hypothetical protein
MAHRKLDESKHMYQAFEIIMRVVEPRAHDDPPVRKPETIEV